VARHAQQANQPAAVTVFPRPEADEKLDFQATIFFKVSRDPVTWPGRNQAEFFDLDNFLKKRDFSARPSSSSQFS
jgi:hypothetical protein